MSIKSIERTIVVSGQKWIDADRLMPDEFSYVLIWYEYKPEEIAYAREKAKREEMYGIGYRVRKKWYVMEDLGEVIKVKAWQPLPPPYENMRKRGRNGREYGDHKRESSYTDDGYDGKRDRI